VVLQCELQSDGASVKRHRLAEAVYLTIYSEIIRLQFYWDGDILSNKKSQI
jgi:hypothetical protein